MNSASTLEPLEFPFFPLVRLSKVIPCLAFFAVVLWPAFGGTNSVLTSRKAGDAYQYLYSVMDKYHRYIDETNQAHACLNIYTDNNAAGNHFIPSGWMGDWGDITFDPGWTNSPYKGIECLRIIYSAQAQQGFGWAGLYWQYPENNWGDLPGAYDLRGATELRFFVRGDVGGEKVEFKVGGINRQPYHDPAVPYQDSCDLLTTGLLTLTNQWTEYVIDLASPEYFWVYQNYNAPENHFAPSGWMGDDGDLTIDENCTNNPYSPPTCIKITYSAAASQGNGWAGIYWQFPAGNWGGLPGGYDLTGATRLTFRARADLAPGQTQTGLMKFLCGGINTPLSGEPGLTNQDSFESSPLWTSLTSSWQEFAIDLTGLDLSNVIGGFCWVTSQNYNPAGCTIYLDDIQFDKLVSKDLSHMIGGFCLAADKTNNPNGCTLYLDNIRYVYAATNWQERMAQRGFLTSYEVQPLPSDDPLRNAAFIYDNALAMLALMARGSDEDWTRSKLLADTFCLAQQNDRYFNSTNNLYDGRLRNAYRAGDLLDPATGTAQLPGWWQASTNQWYEDAGFDGSYTGNMAWAIIPLLGYYEHDPMAKYLDAATDVGAWIAKNRSDSGYGGYRGGLEGFDGNQTNLTWKSTEHNIDAYVAFTLLSQASLDAGQKAYWLTNALHAKNFVTNMWQPSGGFFWTGTAIATNGQEVINTNPIPLDIQAWSILALDDWRTYQPALQWAEKNCMTTNDGFSGFDFSLDQLVPTNNWNGVWFEGTAQMAVADQMSGDLSTSAYFISQVEMAMRQPIDDQGEGVPAASHDGVATGFDWQYYNRLHVGATSWYLFAAQGFDPYWQKGTPARVQQDLGLSIGQLPGGGVALTWNGNAGYTFVIQYCDSLSCPSDGWIEATNLPGQSGPMSWQGVLDHSHRFYRMALTSW